MSTENIDDLFRRRLDGHATPPGNDLWARLQASPETAAATPEPTAAAPERVDQLYQHRLQTHATPPPREIWERLEDEHLRPRRRRAAAWWPLALAATVALLLLGGGAGWWRGFPAGSGRGGAGSTVATQPGNGQPNATPQAAASGTDKGKAGSSEPSPPALAATAASQAAAASAATAVAATATTGQNVAQAAATAVSGLNQKKLVARATRPTGPASGISKAGMMAQQSPRRPRGASRPPAPAAPLVARTTAPRHPPTNLRPADEPAPAPVVATTALPALIPAPGGEIVPAATTAPTAPATATLITVDVRNGAARRPSLAVAVATAAAATEARPGLGGRLLRQVGHAVRGERLSLAEVTGLPENLTLEATIAGRRVSKSIQL